MPIEIRELIIKTEITNGEPLQQAVPGNDDIEHLKKQMMEACKRIVNEQMREKSSRR